MINDVPMITRSSEPNKLDTAEMGTLCKVTSNNEVIYYIQVSSDSENPKWEKLDDIKALNR